MEYTGKIHTSSLSSWLSLLFFFSDLSAQEAVIHTSTSKLYIDQEVQCDISVTIPKGSTPEPYRPPKLLPTFSLKASSQKIKDEELQISFTLAPKKLGRCIFAPGFLSLSEHSRPILLPAASVECVPSGLSSILIAQSLPLYPEKRVTMSTENRLTFFSREQLERVKKDNLAAFIAYENAWRFLAGSLFTIALAMLFLFALVQYELVRKAKEWMKPKEEPLQKLIREMLDPNTPLQERWYRLERFLSLAPLTSAEKEELSPLIARAEAICYGLAPTTVEEWQNAIRSFRLHTHHHPVV